MKASQSAKRLSGDLARQRRTKSLSAFGILGLAAPGGLRRPLQNRREKGHALRLLEGGPPGEQVVQRRAERVDVGADVHLAAAHLFRRRESGGCR